MVSKNQLLLSLSSDELKAIKPYICSIRLKGREVIHEIGKTIEYVYFIESGIVSLMNITAGNLIETATAGCNGVVGGIVALEALTSVHHSIVLIGGVASRIATNDLLHLMTKGHSIRNRLVQNSLAILIHGSQTALCAARHDLEQRLSCWLATTSDTLGGEPIAVTHERIADVLGLRRAGLTEALNQLEMKGVIRKSRGLIQVCAPAELRQRACDCYRVISNSYRYSDQSRDFKCEVDDARL